jgi:hypothetical protein
MDEEFSEFAELDDPAFLAERKRVREALEHVPEQAVSPELEGRYQSQSADRIYAACILNAKINS